MNLSRYVENSPLRYIDPLGTWQWQAPGWMMPYSELCVRLDGGGVNVCVQGPGETCVNASSGLLGGSVDITTPIGDVQASAGIAGVSGNLSDKITGLQADLDLPTLPTLPRMPSLTTNLTGSTNLLRPDLPAHLYAKYCNKEQGNVIGVDLGRSLSAGNGICGVQAEWGIQALVLCDECEVCFYAYAGGGPTIGGGCGLMAQPGAILGHGVFEPDDYTRSFVNLSGSLAVPTPYGAFGGHCGTSSWPKDAPMGQLGSFNPFSADPARAWGPNAPTTYEVGPSYGLSTGGFGGGPSYQYYVLLGCFSVE